MKVQRIAFLAMISAVSCHQPPQQKSLSLATQIHDATETHMGSLGTGFQSGHQHLTDQACVIPQESGTVRSHLNKGSIKAAFNLTENDINNFFGGSVTTTFPIFPGISLSGSIGIKRNHLTNESSETISLLYKGEGSLESLESADLDLSPETREMLSHLPANADRETSLYKVCGDQYVKAVEYGVAFLATLKMTYESEFEKDALDGSVSIGISKIGVGALEPIEKLLPKVEVTFDGTQQLQTTKVRFHLSVYQKGGQPEKLLELLPTQAAESGALVCTFEDRKLCFQAFKRIALYVKNQLPAQLSDPARLAPIGFMTNDYVQPAIAALAPSAGRARERAEAFDRLVELRRPLTAEWEQTESDLAFLQQIKQNLSDLSREMGTSLSCEPTPSPTGDEASPDPEPRSPLCDVQDLLQRIKEKQTRLAKALADCGKLEDIQVCEKIHKETLQLAQQDQYKVDRSRLENLPQSFDVWCQLYFQSGWLSPERRQTVGALLDLAGFPKEKAYQALESKKEEGTGFSLVQSCQAAALDLKIRTQLDLSNKAVKDLLPLASFWGVQALNLAGNNIQARDLWPLSWLTNLQCLDLSNNLLTDPGILQSFPAAGPGKLHLGRNYLTQSSLQGSWPWQETIWEVGDTCMK